MRSLIVFALIAMFLTGFAGIAAGGEKQAVEVKMSDIIDHSAFATKWGNVYFRDRDIKRLTHAAAKLKSVNLGDFKTDKDQMVKVQAIGYQTGTATLVVTLF